MLAEILNQLPRDLAAPIVIAQHIDEGYVAGLAKWLADQTTLPVEVAVIRQRTSCRPRLFGRIAAASSGSVRPAIAVR